MENSLKKIPEQFFVFFRKCPAFLFSLAFLFGLAIAVRPNLIFGIVFFSLSLPWILFKPKQFAPTCAIFFIAFLYGITTKPFFPNDLQKITGVASFTPSEIKEYKTHFKKSYALKGTIEYMEDENATSVARIPCTIPLEIKLPLRTEKYLIPGCLEKEANRFLFTPDENSTWIGTGKMYSLPQWRFDCKKEIAKKIQKIYGNSLVEKFLVAICLGDLSDPLLRFSFNRLGLQHILAISGFHFGLLAFFLNFIFSLFLSKKPATICLLLLLTGYFVLVGCSASILRAYLASTLYLIGTLSKRSTTPLNILGVVLLLELLFKPESITNLGFQLSFLATGSILILFPLTSSWVKKFLPKRTELEAFSLRKIDRWAYLICAFIRSALALNLAVHLTVIPVCLFYFGKFPVISLFYNLFIPLGVSCSLFLFLGSLPFLMLVPPLGILLSEINHRFTQFILQLIIEAPNRFSIYLKTPEIFPSITTPLVIISLIIILLLPVVRPVVPPTKDLH